MRFADSNILPLKKLSLLRPDGRCNDSFSLMCEYVYRRKNPRRFFRIAMNS